MGLYSQKMSNGMPFYQSNAYSRRIHNKDGLLKAHFDTLKLHPDPVRMQKQMANMIHNAMDAVNVLVSSSYHEPSQNNLKTTN